MNKQEALLVYRGAVMLNYTETHWTRAYECRECGMLVSDVGRFRHYRWHRDDDLTRVRKMQETVDALWGMSQ